MTHELALFSCMFGFILFLWFLARASKKSALLVQQNDSWILRDADTLEPLCIESPKLFPSNSYPTDTILKFSTPVAAKNWCKQNGVSVI
jgi:hypothetical protein